MRQIAALLFLLVYSTIGFCTNNDTSILSEVKAAYDSHNYAEAADMINSIGEKDGVSPELYLDLGNSYFLANEYGKCVVAYMRGLRLEPRNSELRANLGYVLSKVDDKNISQLKGKPGSVLPDPPSFFENIGHAISKSVNPDLWAWLGIMTFLLSVISAAIYIFLHAVVVRKIGFFSCLVLLGASLLFNIFAFAARNAYYEKNTCVLIEYEGELRVEPSSKSPQTGITLSAGTPLEIIQEESTGEGETWYKVKLNSENIGWIETSMVEVV